MAGAGLGPAGGLRDHEHRLNSDRRLRIDRQRHDPLRFLQVSQPPSSPQAPINSQLFQFSFINDNFVKDRFKRLRTPANVLVMNLTACDFISCLIHPMAIYSAYRGRWSFGKTGESLA